MSSLAETQGNKKQMAISTALMCCTLPPTRWKHLWRRYASANQSTAANAIKPQTAFRTIGEATAFPSVPQPNQVTGPGLKGASALPRPQCSLQVRLLPLAVSRMNWKIC